MSVRTMMVVVLAMVCGLGAAGGIFWLRRQPAASSLIETTPVIFATVDIQRGETIKEDMIELRQIPVDQVTMPGISDVDEVVDRSASDFPMLKGDVVSARQAFAQGVRSRNGIIDQAWNAGVYHSGHRAVIVICRFLTSRQSRGCSVHGDKFGWTRRPCRRRHNEHAAHGR